MFRFRHFALTTLWITVACISAFSQTTGRIAGLVMDIEGKPISQAKMSLYLISRNITKVIYTDSKGLFIQAGLEPSEFEITVSAIGFDTAVARKKVDLGDTTKFNVTLYRAGSSPKVSAEESAAAEKYNTTPNDPGLKLDGEARDLFNNAIPLYKEKQYKEASSLFIKSYEAMEQALVLIKDEESRKESLSLVPKILKALGLSLYSSGEKDKAIPYLLKVTEQNPTNASNADIIEVLIRYYSESNNKENTLKYQALLVKLVGPRPELTYNEAVTNFNNGSNKKARENIKLTLEANSKFSEAYWLLGMIEYSDGNTAGAKSNFLKYLELEPNGRYAKEVRQELKNF